MNIDRCANFIIHTLEDAGYEAYIVGGCVRDSILGRKPKDWDICTSAEPNSVYELFGDLGLSVIDTGKKYGTISIIMNDLDVDLVTGDDNRLYSLEEEVSIYEVTTFRNGSGSRHPQLVTFTTNLEDDIRRRDFTMNALAYNSRTGLIDLVGGVEDIHNGIIRCVGDPDYILREDPLRIIRALRFEAQLGFSLDSSVDKALRTLSAQGFISLLSPERIQSELFKLISGSYCTKIFREYTDVICAIIPELTSTVGFDQHNPNHRLCVYDHLIETVEFMVNQGVDDTNLRMAALLHDIGKPAVAYTRPDGVMVFHGHASVSATMAEKILRRLNCPNDTIKDIFSLIKYHDSMLESKSSVKRLTNKIGIANTFRLFDLRHADILAQSSFHIDEKIAHLRQMRNWLNEIVSNHEEFMLRDLEINGRDLIRMGYRPGKQFSIILNSLFDLVLDGAIPNTHDTLVDYVVEHFPILEN